MRKKLFAILMSAMMMVTFMPAMAFAADPIVDQEHGYAIADSDLTSWTAFKNAYDALLSPVEKASVEIVAEPTHDAKGTVVLTCTKHPVGVESTEDFACGYKKTVKFDKLSTTDSCNAKYLADVTMSVQEWANAKVAAGQWTATKGKAYVATKKDTVCYVVGTKCSQCGKVYEAASNAENLHVAPEGANASCTETVTCANPGCNAVVKKGVNRAKHSYESEVGTIAKEANATEANFVKNLACDDSVKLYKVKCTECKQEATFEYGTPSCSYFTDNVADDMTWIETPGYWKGIAIEWTGGTPRLKDGYKVVSSDEYSWVNDRNARFYAADTTVTDADGNIHYGYTCKECKYVVAGAVKTAASDAVKCEHAWEQNTIKATCTENAKTYEQCAKCGRYKNVTAGGVVTAVATMEDATLTAVKNTALGHDYVVTKTDTTCATSGHYTITCSRCNEINETVYQNQFNDETKASIFWTDGTSGAVKKTAIELAYLPKATGHHTFTKKVTLKAATCTNNEIVGYICDECGKVSMHDPNPAIVVGTILAHNEKTVVVPATCADEGYSYKICETCGRVNEPGTTNWTKVDVNAANFATTYGFNKVKALGGKCDMAGAMKVVKEATLFEEGIKASTCSKCGAVNAHAHTVTIAKLSYAAPKVSVKKGKVIVTVAAQTGAVKYVVKAGKKTKTVTAAGKVTLKKVAKKGKKAKVTVTAYNAAGAKVVSKAKTVKAK